MAQMPNSNQMKAINGRVNPSRITRVSVGDMTRLEARGRAARDARPTQVGVVRGVLEADFPSGGGSGTGRITEYLSFGEYKFMAPPDFYSGQSHIPMPGTVMSRVWDDAHDFDPTTEVYVPCLATHFMYHYDDADLIDGAYIIVCALDAVPDGFVTNIHWMYVGTAIRY